jgi:hypothetical protein
MYNNDEYSRPGYESNYEFNPQQEEEFEFENSEYEFNNEYELNPELEMEQNYEYSNEFEDEFPRQNRPVVHDHRTGYNQASARVYNAPRSYRNFNTPARSAYSGSIYRPSAYRRPQVYRNYFSGYRNYPWYNRYRQAPGSYWGIGYNNPAMSNVDQSIGQSTTSGYAPQASSGGDVPSYISDTIKNLSQQVAATNANVQALQQTFAGNSPQSGGPQPPAGSPISGAPMDSSATAGQQPSGDHEMENYEMENYEYEMEDEMMNYNGGDELNEMELASQLLETNNEMELDHFLGGLLGGAGGGLSKLLKGVVKAALPVAGAAAGSFFGGPLGGMVGQKIGSAASGMFELELEGLSNEDQEFEIARAIIRLGMDAAKKLTEEPSTGDPHQDAKNALIQSAMHNAPGLLVKKHHHHHGVAGSHGHWHRRDNKIIIENAY